MLRRVMFMGFVLLVSLIGPVRQSLGIEGLPESIGRRGDAPIARLVAMKIIDRTGGAERTEDLQIEYRHEHAIGDGIAVTTSIKNLTDQLRCMEVQYHFRLKDVGYEVFTAGEGGFESFPEDGTLVAQYLAGWFGKRLVIPVGTLYARNAGFTACAELVTPIPSFIFSAERVNGSVNLVVTRSRLRLDPNGSRSVTTHFIAHEGCWRPGLAFAREHWPELFYVKEGAEILQVRGNAGGGLASYYAYNGLDEKFWRTYNMKSSPWDDGFAFPYLFAWFGNYYFDEIEGGCIPRVMTKWHDIHQHPEHYPEGFLDGKPPEDAPWRDIVEWLNSREVDWELFQKFRHTEGMPVGAQMWAKFTHERIKEMLTLSKKYGPVTMAYWNPSEVWDNWALDVFKGYEVPGWHHHEDCTLANIHPGSPVEKIYWRKAKAIIDNYDDLTGLHVDQAYYGWYDRRHDDGFSIDEHGAFSDLHRNIGRLVRKVTEYAHSKGKYTDQNPPQASIEVTGWTDLACVEDRCSPEVGQEFGRYGTIGNRGCIQLYPFEERMQTNLRNGWFTPMGVSDEAHLDAKPRNTNYWLSRLYPPIFDLFRGREWVLEPNCLELPEGYDGNLFKRPDGNYVATVISRGEHTTTSYWRVAVPVTIRLTEARRVRGAYLISADQLGPKKLSFEREGNSVTVRLPRHKSASAILLGIAGRFVSLEHSSFRTGRLQTVNVICDNFTDDQWDFDALVAYPGNNYKLEAHVAPGESAQTRFYADYPRQQASAHGFFRFRMHMDPGGVIPMPEEADRHIATFEVADENSVGFWVAPSLPLVSRRQSNSTQGGYKPYWNVFPLHVNVAEKALFEVGLVNNTDEDVQAKLTYTVKGGRIVAAPASVSLQARAFRRVPVTVEGTQPGAGELAVVILTPGTNTTRTCPFQVFGSRLAQDDLPRVKSVSLVADLWGRTSKSKEKPVFLNGSEVGILEGGFGGNSVWTLRVRTKLSDSAPGALQLANTLRIDNPQKDSFKIRRAMLEVTTDDNRTFLLRADSYPVSTAKEEVWEDNKPHEVDWTFAEGRRVGLGEAIELAIPLHTQ